MGSRVPSSGGTCPHQPWSLAIMCGLCGRSSPISTHSSSKLAEKSTKRRNNATPKSKRSMGGISDGWRTEVTAWDMARVVHESARETPVFYALEDGGQT